MDLVQMLTSVEFSEVRRGLDRDEVAAFLQQVGNAVVGLERRLAETTVRAEKAEARAVELADDTSLRRTLVLAQRTADAAIAEAEEESRRILMEAEQRASARIAEADAHSERTRTSAEETGASTIQAAQTKAAQLIVEAKAEARRASEELRTKLRKEVMELERARDVLNRDVTLFETHMGEQRTRVQGAIGALQMVLDHPDALRKMALPPLGQVQIPEATAPDDTASGQDALGYDALGYDAASARAMASSSSDAITESVGDDELQAAVVEAAAARLEPFADSSDTGAEVPAVDDEIDLRVGQMDPITAEVPVVVPGEDPALSFFDERRYSDDRWKPRRERRPG